MLPPSLWLLCLAAIGAQAQSSESSAGSSASDASSSPSSSGTASLSSSGRRGESFSPITYTQTIRTASTPVTEVFTGSEYTYATDNGQSTVTSTTGLPAQNASMTSSSNSQITRTSKQQSLTAIVGGPQSSSNATMTSSTSSAALPMNTQPCNNYPEFCNRKYSNITEVCAHNSAFAIPNNAGSNQALPITDQLNDGVRMLQGETHWVNDTVYNCHTTCDLLNAGTWQSELETIASWLESHPFDVVTFLIVNSDQVAVENYVAAVQNSGIAQYLYTPAYVPQHRDQWPTLGEMILSGKRMVMFMDYKANQQSVPYILDEFTHMWETPFSPQNQSFPCDIQRPPGLNETIAREQYMYLANHNLNTAIDLGVLLGTNNMDAILVPNTAEINQTNGQYNQYGQLAAMNQNCSAQWDRPPNFLLVDYYNYGMPNPGSVFEVAARANGVNYNRPCCGINGNASPAMRSSLLVTAAAVAFAVLLVW